MRNEDRLYNNFQICNLKMGCANEGQFKIGQTITPKPHLTVASLNYCGIMNSPFQFYCQEYEAQLKKISEAYLTLLPKYIPNFSKEKFKWQMGKIDLKIRVGRYSPLFQPYAGIENGRFLNKMEFDKKWQEIFQVQLKKSGIQIKQKEKQVTKLYDFLAYHTILKYVYNLDDIEELIQKDPQPYLKVIKPFFQLSFLNEERKIKKLVDNFAKIETDVFFFQEYSPVFYSYLEKRLEHFICVDDTKDTMIIAKQASFSKKKDTGLVLSKLTDQQRKNLNWADRSAILILDNYIFISAHLSSKADKNKPQIEQLKKGLIDLKRALPQYQIIVGGDLNSYLPSFSKQFNIYPSLQTQLTTIKKRTMTQGQFHKAQKVVQQSKDKIISTLQIKNPHIMYINGRIPSKDNYVPSNQHPFDHFVVVAQLQKNDIQ